MEEPRDVQNESRGGMLRSIAKSIGLSLLFSAIYSVIRRLLRF